MRLQDGSGTISKNELALVFESLGQKPSMEDMDLIMKEVDLDGSGTVDLQEFCQLMGAR